MNFNDENFPSASDIAREVYLDSLEPLRQWTPGDDCRILGDYKVEHVNCDDYADNTVVDLRTGEVVYLPPTDPSPEWDDENAASGARL